MTKLACAALLASFLCACDGGGDPGAKHDAGPAHDAATADATPADAGPAPLLRNPVSLDDEALANQALTLLGLAEVGGSNSCNDCHSIRRPLLHHWSDMASAALSHCLTDLAVTTPESAHKMLDCLRADPNNPTSLFMTANLGPYSAAAHLDWFRYVFQRAYGSAWEAAYEGFKVKVAMPKGAHTPFTQAQFDIVAEWFARGMPFIELVPDDPPPTGCTNSITAEVTAHVAEMKQSGWSAVNAENHILMFGCGGAATARACLSTYPRAADTAYGAGWEALPNTKLRVLRDIPYSSSYWTRSSADGRFVAHGGGDANPFDYGSSIVDLQQNKVIPTAASYDPGFFPDNSGFVFQGAQASFCEQTVLTASPTSVSLNEVGCTGTNLIGLYQHVGAALGGGDYMVVDSFFANDDGGHDVTIGDPTPFFGSDTNFRLTRMVHTGNKYVPGTQKELAVPYEGDTVISPSSRLLVSRLAGPDNSQRGYVLRKIKTTTNPDGSLNVTAPEVGRYCVHGAKPNFSFDERWMVIHHYVEDADAVELGFTEPNDPAFQAYRDKGSSNLYLVDLLTGARTRVTKLKPGQYALYPHFRSDGWIYFIVRTLGEQGEHIVASDAALVLAGAP